MVELKPMTLKVWATGSGYVVTIPKALVEGLGIEKGDLIKLRIEDVIKDAVNKGKGGGPK